MSEIFGFDAFSPKEIVARVEAVGVTKARLSAPATLLLGVLAGAFIGFGAMMATIVGADGTLGFAGSRLLSGLVFSLGLVLVVVAGAELFTGNNLLVMAWADRRISTAELLRNWALVLLGNLIGAVLLAIAYHFARGHAVEPDPIARQAWRVAAAKAALPFMTAFWRGVLCNVLVCLAVWMALAGRSVVDKIVAIVLPVTAFVAAGFEHSVANFYFFTLAAMIEGSLPETAVRQMTLNAIISNLLPVLLGNIAGGAGLVAVVYHLIYRRAASRSE